MVVPEVSDSTPAPADPGYAVNPDDNITLLASKVIRDVLVTRAEPVRRRELWQAVELAMGDRSPDVDGVLKGAWFNNPVYGKWVLTDAAAASDSPFTDAAGAISLPAVVEYLHRCQGEAPYIGVVGEFIKICRPGLELDAGWLVSGNRAIR